MFLTRTQLICLLGLCVMPLLGNGAWLSYKVYYLQTRLDCAVQTLVQGEEDPEVVMDDHDG